MTGLPPQLPMFHNSTFRCPECRARMKLARLVTRFELRRFDSPNAITSNKSPHHQQSNEIRCCSRLRSFTTTAAEIEVRSWTVSIRGRHVPEE